MKERKRPATFKYLNWASRHEAWPASLGQPTGCHLESFKRPAPPYQLHPMSRPWIKRIVDLVLGTSLAGHSNVSVIDLPTRPDFNFVLSCPALQTERTSTSNQTMKSYLLSATLAVVLLLTAADKKEKDTVQWQSVKVNETVTAEATLDILIKNFDASGDLHGTLRIALFGETVPMTVLNFFSICNGVKRPSGELKYANTFCHRLVPDMNFQCGDVTTGDGSGGISMFGDTFNDENFNIGISEKGTIAMANKGPNSNGSQFFVVFRSWQYLDNLHVAFGQVVGKESLEFLDKIAQVEVEKDGITPSKKIKIVDCEAKDVKKYKIQRRASVNDDKF
ncbi:Peptidyl-prolyl cis-trans isomerase cyp6 [Bulinus truncatus]|nr:Peptidyl-prolyl cis-trans isomerase cyp6 [Bulinus truncatus]